MVTQNRVSVLIRMFQLHHSFRGALVTLKKIFAHTDGLSLGTGQLQQTKTLSWACWHCFKTDGGKNPRSGEAIQPLRAQSLSHLDITDCGDNITYMLTDHVSGFLSPYGICFVPQIFIL